MTQVMSCSNVQNTSKPRPRADRSSVARYDVADLVSTTDELERKREREREKLHTARIGSRGIGARRVRSTRVVREQESSTEASPPTARYKARSAKTAALSRKTVHSNKQKGKRRRNSASSRKTDQPNSRAWGTPACNAREKRQELDAQSQPTAVRTTLRNR